MTDDLIRDQHYPQADEADVVPALCMEKVSGTVQPLDKVLPIEERSYEADCKHCNTRLAFQVKHVFRTYETYWAMFMQTPDGYMIKCPTCFNAVNVIRVLPDWVAKRI